MAVGGGRVLTSSSSLPVLSSHTAHPVEGNLSLHLLTLCDCQLTQMSRCQSHLTSAIQNTYRKNTKRKREAGRNRDEEV